VGQSATAVLIFPPLPHVDAELAGGILPLCPQREYPVSQGSAS
jgi:hypothetical protein